MVAALGMAMICFGLIPLAFIDTETPVVYIIYTLIVLGAGFASPNTTAIMNMSSPRTYGTSTAFLAIMRFLGQALSVSIITSVMRSTSSLIESLRTFLTIYIELSAIGTILMFIAGTSQYLDVVS